MPNHPNRSGKSPARNPSPDEIRQAREAAGLTQPEAAALIHSTLRTWQDWEAGIARMHAGLWELFRLKAPVETPLPPLALLPCPLCGSAVEFEYTPWNDEDDTGDDGTGTIACPKCRLELFDDADSARTRWNTRVKPQKCSTCSHWQPYAEAFPNAAPHAEKESGGICRSKLMREEWDEDGYQPKALVYSYCEGGYFWTGPDFGCVNHAPK